MNASSKRNQSNARTIWATLLVLVVVGAGSAGYFYRNQTTTAPHALSTKTARTGNLTLAISGSVTLIPSQEKALAFTVSGMVAQLNVAVGDPVKKGQVLAQLDNLADLQADIQTAEQDVLTAQQNLAAFKAKAPANLANAQLALINAQQALETAQGSVVQPNSVRCDSDTKTQLYNAYERAVAKLDALGDGGGAADFYLNRILPQKQVVDQTKGALDACAGFTNYQVALTQANLTLAEAKVKLAQTTYDTLVKNNGLNPTDLTTAENKIASAQEALDSAKDALDGATLIAPFDGTVLSVSGKAGDTVAISAKTPKVTFITVADLIHPLLTFTIDETDMDMLAKGESATVRFDAFAERTFKGTVTRVDPALSGSSTSNTTTMNPGGGSVTIISSGGSSSSTASVTGQITLDLSQEQDVPAFPKDLSGSVQIIQAAAENALLIPVEALQAQSDGSTIVYVLGADGEPAKRTVTVGLRDVASAQITSGLSAGEMVITSGLE